MSSSDAVTAVEADRCFRVLSPAFGLLSVRAASGLGCRPPSSSFRNLRGVAGGDGRVTDLAPANLSTVPVPASTESEAEGALPSRFGIAECPVDGAGSGRVALSRAAANGDSGKDSQRHWHLAIDQLKAYSPSISAPVRLAMGVGG